MLYRGILGAAIAALFGAAAVAETGTGNVREVDGEARTVTLESGDVFVLPENYDDPRLGEAGSVATITYEVVDGRNVATDIIVEGRKSE